MERVTLAVAIYGAALSSFLGYLAWKRDRHQIFFAPSFHPGEGWSRLDVAILNAGHRPVTLASAHFETDDGGGYLPVPDESLGLPCKLAEGDSLPMSFDAEDLWPATCAIVVRAYDREHRHVFERDFRREWEWSSSDD